MASAGSQADTSQVDQSSVQQPPKLADRGTDIRKAEFTNVGNSQNSSKRPGAKCNHCEDASGKLEHLKATTDNLKKHILRECKGVPADVRKYWLDEFSSKQASSTAGEQAVIAGVKRKAQQQHDIRRSLPSKAWDLSSTEQEDVSYHLLRFAVTANLGFRQLNNVHLHAALSKLRPQYNPPAPTTLTRMLDQEYLGVMAKLKQKISQSQNLTLSLDGWTDACKRAIIAFVLMFPDRTICLLESREVSLEKHTGEFLAGLIKEVINKHELREKLAMLVTDNAANMVLARTTVVGSDGFKHILEMRCSLHGFSLVLKSVLTHPWAKGLLIRAQQVVTYFRASHAPLAALRAAAEALGITHGLQSSNTTRMTSGYSCTSSVQRNAPAFTRMQSSSDVEITNSDVEQTLGDAAFWADLAKLNKVLAPICRVIMVVQGDSTTLADVSRCWLYLAHALGEVLAGVPESFQTHIIWAYSTRAKQQDQVLCRLALFLDPRYRQAALSSSSNIMASFVQEAAKYGYLQGWGEAKIQQLLQQLSSYSKYLAPFNLPAAGAGFTCQMWWSTVGQNADGAVLAELAGVLLDVVPHAAGSERVFSQMGWFEGTTSHRMATSTTAKKVAIKLHYDAVQPAKRKCVELSKVKMPDCVNLTGPALISQSAAAAAGPKAAAAAAAAAADEDGQEEEEEEDSTPEQLDRVLQEQAAADEHEKQKAEQPPEDCRTSWRKALQWAMGVDKAQDLLDPAYQEVYTGPKLRTVSAPAAGVDPSALAAQFLAQQQQQQQVLQQQQQMLQQQQQHMMQQQQGLLPVAGVSPFLAQALTQTVLQQQLQLAQLQQQHPK